MLSTTKNNKDRWEVEGNPSEKRPPVSVSLQQWSTRLPYCCYCLPMQHISADRNTTSHPVLLIWIFGASHIWTDEKIFMTVIWWKWASVTPGIWHLHHLKNVCESEALHQWCYAKSKCYDQSDFCILLNINLVDFSFLLFFSPWK